MAVLKITSALLLLCLTVSSRLITEKTGEGKQWALLVAGSSGWGNYRHQADICHAYQIMHKHGIPDENIVVMMYDDLAHNEKNKYPGKIFNRPGGPDVYHGVLKDYIGEDVTPNNFINVLTGNKRAMNGIGSGKVIDSGPNDHVFVFFADHGAPGLVAFPDSMLSARTLQKAILQMHEDNKYQKMVFYIEACESGSMFKGFPNNLEVYATTASDPRHSSYACYFDKELETYLGDVYSVKWMENDDKVDIQKETLLEQYKVLVKEVNTSHVMKYGDMSFDNLPLSEFMGPKEVAAEIFPEVPITDAVPAPDVPLVLLERKLMEAQTEEEERKLSAQLNRMIELREQVSRAVEQIAEDATESEEQKKHVLEKVAEPTDFNCYEEVLERFSTNCFNLGQNDYALRQVYVLSNLCEEKISLEKITDAIDNNCEVNEPDGEQPLIL